VRRDAPPPRWDSRWVESMALDRRDRRRAVAHGTSWRSEIRVLYRRRTASRIGRWPTSSPTPDWRPPVSRKLLMHASECLQRGELVHAA